MKARARTKKKGGSTWQETFVPPEMLIMSSPMERKVSYTQLKNFKSVGNTVLPILDAGLIAPYGLAWDAPRSALYICDGALRKIIRVKLKAFKCLRQCKGLDIQLKVEGNIYTVVDNVISQWATVDEKGNLYWSAQDSNSIGKLPVKTIDMIIKDQIMAKDLKVTSEVEAEGEEAGKEAIEDEDSNTTTVTTPQPPSIFHLYEKDVSENVGTPAGIVAEGSRLYWTNQMGGLSSGSVVEGKTNPRIKKPAGGGEAVVAAPAAPAAEGAEDEGGSKAVDAAAADEKPTFPSTKVTENVPSAYGIALTSSKILYTNPSHYVWACSRGTGETVSLTSGLLKPRGIVWDGDNTVYIADQEGNYIVSMPIGLLKPGAPVSHTLDIHSPFGLALVGKQDPIWDPLEAAWAAAHRAADVHSWVFLVLSAALTMTQA